MEHLDPAAGKPDLKKRVVLIGVGGASCSGKTTLAKHLRTVLPGSFIIHQDDFAPPEQQVPYHPTLNVQDWDDPVGAIDWPRMVKFIREVRQSAALREDWKSHDALNPQTPVPLPDGLLQLWAARFDAEKRRVEEEEGEEIIWALVDGFLLYWHPDIARELDVRLFLRVSHKTLKHRRDNRYGYHTAVLFQPEGSWWQDPPGYWNDIVWPAYLKAHSKMFQNNDVEHGEPLTPPLPLIRNDMAECPVLNPVENGVGIAKMDGEMVNGKDEQTCGLPVDKLNVFNAENMGMEGLFITACECILGGKSTQ